MRIGFIGAGKVGFSLGKFFAVNNLHVTGYYSRHIESAKAAAEFTDTDCYSDIKELIYNSDAIFLTVPDGSISSVFDEIKHYNIKDKQICHCSGAMSSRDSFPGINETGAFGYSIHPLFPVSSKFETYSKLTDAFFCLEGDDVHLREWEDRLRSLGVRTRVIPQSSKAAYHLACATASNLVCALIRQSLDLLTEECGFSVEDALAALKPLAKRNLDAVLEKGPAEALTGPLERNDASTIRKHLAVLEARPKEKKLYEACSYKLLDVARAKHPNTDFSEIELLLKEKQNEKYSGNPC